MAANSLLTIPWGGLGRGQVWHGESAPLPHTCALIAIAGSRVQTIYRLSVWHSTVHVHTVQQLHILYDKYRWDGGGGSKQQSRLFVLHSLTFPFHSYTFLFYVITFYNKLGLVVYSAYQTRQYSSRPCCLTK
jgi:hypothetical protein